MLTVQLGKGVSTYQTSPALSRCPSRRDRAARRRHRPPSRYDGFVTPKSCLSRRQMDGAEVRRRMTLRPGPESPLETRSPRLEEPSSRPPGAERNSPASPLPIRQVQAQEAPQVSPPQPAWRSSPNAAPSPQAMRTRPARRPQCAPTSTCCPEPSSSALQAELTAREPREVEEHWREEREANGAACLAGVKSAGSCWLTQAISIS